MSAGCVVNCAGNYSDEVHGMAANEEDGGGGFDIRPARGKSQKKLRNILLKFIDVY